MAKITFFHYSQKISWCYSQNYLFIVLFPFIHHLNFLAWLSILVACKRAQVLRCLIFFSLYLNLRERTLCEVKTYIFRVLLNPWCTFRTWSYHHGRKMLLWLSDRKLFCWFSLFLRKKESKEIREFLWNISSPNSPVQLYIFLTKISF